jgi:hypothetical protein
MSFSLLTILIVLWGILTLSLIGLMVYRGVIGRNEELELMVNQAEHRFADEQHNISDRIEHLSRPIRYLSFAVAGLLLLIIAVWVYQGLQS